MLAHNINQTDNLYYNNQLDCTFYSTETIGTITLNDQNLNLLHINIRSTAKNLDELLLTLDKYNLHFSVIVLTETWLKSSYDWTDIPGYTAYHSIREGRAGGGVTTLVASYLIAESISSLTCNNNCHESIGVKIDANGEVFTVIGTYRPPSSPLPIFNNEYFSFLSNANHNRKLLVLGDFNVDLLSDTPARDVLSFSDNFRSEHLQSLINRPTRITHHSETCLDHIYINSMQSLTSGVIELTVSDHNAIFCSIPFAHNVNRELKLVQFRDHSTHNIEVFKQEIICRLNSFHYYRNFSISDQFEIFNNIINDAYFTSFPIKKKNVSIKRYKSPWMTNSLLNRITDKHRLYRLSKTNQDYINVYKNYRNILGADIKHKKNSYFLNKFANCDNNTKSTWKLINKILKPNDDKKNIKLLNNNYLTTEPSEIADLFNDHFSAIAHDLASKISVVNVDPISYVDPVPNSFVYFETHSSEINKIIQSFPSKPTHVNAIPSFIYKSIGSIISPILAKLIN